MPWILGGLKDEIEKDEKVMLRAADKINNMEVEQEAPRGSRSRTRRPSCTRRTK